MKEILDEVQKRFFEKLETQTNWGKNQVKELYKQCELEVLREKMDLIYK